MLLSIYTQVTSAWTQWWGGPSWAGPGRRCSGPGWRWPAAAQVQLPHLSPCNLPLPRANHLHSTARVSIPGNSAKPASAGLEAVHCHHQQADRVAGGGSLFTWYCFRTNSYFTCWGFLVCTDVAWILPAKKCLPFSASGQWAPCVHPLLTIHNLMAGQRLWSRLQVILIWVFSVSEIVGPSKRGKPVVRWIIWW